MDSEQPGVQRVEGTVRAVGGATCGALCAVAALQAEKNGVSQSFVLRWQTSSGSESDRPPQLHRP